MQRLEFSGAVRPLYGSLGVKGFAIRHFHFNALRLAALCHANPICLMGILFLIYAHFFNNTSRT